MFMSIQFLKKYKFLLVGLKVTRIIKGLMVFFLLIFFVVDPNELLFSKIIGMYLFYDLLMILVSAYFNINSEKKILYWNVLDFLFIWMFIVIWYFNWMENQFFIILLSIYQIHLYFSHINLISKFRQIWIKNNKNFIIFLKRVSKIKKDDLSMLHYYPVSIEYYLFRNKLTKNLLFFYLTWIAFYLLPILIYYIFSREKILFVYLAIGLTYLILKFKHILKIRIVR